MKNSENIISGKHHFILSANALLLAAVSLLLGWLAFGLKAWVTFYNVLLVWFALLFLLLYNIRKVNRDVAKFFELIQDQDSMQNFQYSKSAHSGELRMQMNRVIDRLSGLRSEKEKDYLFFRSVFDHADTGLVVYDEEGTIVLSNKAAIKLLGLKNSMKISDTLLPEKIGKTVRRIVNLEVNGDAVQLSLRTRQIKISEKTFILLSIQNIRQELEQHEVESWQKLIRIFIHEIMNSVSPITLTSSAIINMVEKTSVSPENQVEIVDGLKAIRKRSKGISAFMDSYRQISSIPIPDFNWVSAEKLTDNVIQLMSKDFSTRNISFIKNIPHEEIRIWCDEKLIEHVLINLLKNAVEALNDSKSPEIRISCVELSGRVELSVHDNGQGIEPDKIDNLFVPFYTTKPEGTGIGLSLSRQVMNLHGGSIFVNSKKGDTNFTLSFPVHI